MTTVEFIRLAIAEDVGDGDHSSLACIPSDKQGKAKLLVKEDGVIAGVELALEIFREVDKDLTISVFIEDGSPIKKGDIVLTVEGLSQSILKAERLGLNCMQRMSGIATQTNNINALIADTGAKLLDTRKTTPLLRFMEKWAVRIGGGVNHRFGLYDMIMLKDNHVDYAGGVTKAIHQTKEYLKKTGRNLKIEVETRNFDEINEVLSCGGIDRIMLDNFSIENTKKAVELINRRFEIESSGGITIENIREYALCGVDYISVGALTHSVKSLDLSLKAEF